MGLEGLIVHFFFGVSQEISLLFFSSCSLVFFLSFFLIYGIKGFILWKAVISDLLHERFSVTCFVIRYFACGVHIYGWRQLIYFLM